MWTVAVKSLAVDGGAISRISPFFPLASKAKPRRSRSGSGWLHAEPSSRASRPVMLWTDTLSPRTDTSTSPSTCRRISHWPLATGAEVGFIARARNWVSAKAGRATAARRTVATRRELASATGFRIATAEPPQRPEARAGPQIEEPDTFSMMGVMSTRESMVDPPAGFSPQAAQRLTDLERSLSGALNGKPEVIRLSLVCLLARGHLLLEDVPGVGKTTLAQALARSVSCRFHRLQFTSDMLPSDVLGVTIYNAHVGAFEFKPGPIFSNFLLADEINRTTPKTQSALLEAARQACRRSDRQCREPHGGAFARRGRRSGDPGSSCSAGTAASSPAS